MPEKKSTKKPTKSRNASKGFTAEERAAMKERARELKAEERRGKDRAAGEKDLLEKIAEMPKTWYGMPAYAKEGKVLCFFQSADKFKSRYATFGFTDEANLDSGPMWPTSFALKDLTAAEEKKIGALVKKAVR